MFALVPDQLADGADCFYPHRRMGNAVCDRMQYWFMQALAYKIAPRETPQKSTAPSWLMEASPSATGGDMIWWRRGADHPYLFRLGTGNHSISRAVASSGARENRLTSDSLSHAASFGCNFAEASHAVAFSWP